MKQFVICLCTEDIEMYSGLEDWAYADEEWRKDFDITVMTRSGGLKYNALHDLTWLNTLYPVGGKWCITGFGVFKTHAVTSVSLCFLLADQDGRAQLLPPCLPPCHRLTASETVNTFITCSYKNWISLEIQNVGDPEPWNICQGELRADVGTSPVERNTL